MITLDWILKCELSLFMDYIVITDQYVTAIICSYSLCSYFALFLGFGWDTTEKEKWAEEILAENIRQKVSYDYVEYEQYCYDTLW